MASFCFFLKMYLLINPKRTYCIYFMVGLQFIAKNVEIINKGIFCYSQSYTTSIFNNQYYKVILGTGNCRTIHYCSQLKQNIYLAKSTIHGHRQERQRVQCQVFQLCCSLTRKQEEENTFRLVRCTKVFEIAMLLGKFLDMVQDRMQFLSIKEQNVCRHHEYHT